MKRYCPGVNLKPTHTRFLFYKFLTAVPVFAAVLAMLRYGDGFASLVAYALILGVHVLVMFTSKCPHCAYYHSRDRLHRCFMMWWFPKLRAPSTKSAPKFLAVYVPLAVLLITFYPVYWLRFEWELLLIYLVTVALILYSILIQECPCCAYFDCPGNRVPLNVRKACRGRR